MRTRRFYPRKAAHKGQTVWTSVFENNRLKIVPMKIVAVSDWADMSSIKPRGPRRDYLVYYWCKPINLKYVNQVPGGHALDLGYEIFLTRREARLNVEGYLFSSR